MRLALAAAAFLVAVGPGSAECRQLTLGETTSSFIEALKPRLNKLGAKISLDASGTINGDIYSFDDSAVFINADAKDDILIEVGTTLFGKHSDKELDEMISVAAFTIARYTSEFEADIKDMLYEGLDMHTDPSSWYFRTGIILTTMTVHDDGGIGAVIHKCV